MPVSPTGNVIIVNQQMHVASNVSSNLQNRFDLQNLAAMIKANEREENKSVRPTEENHHIDPENEHEKEKIDEEERQKQKNKNKHNFKGENEKEQEEEVLSSHILDLKG